MAKQVRHGLDTDVRTTNRMAIALVAAVVTAFAVAAYAGLHHDRDQPPAAGTALPAPSDVVPSAGPTGVISLYPSPSATTSAAPTRPSVPSARPPAPAPAPTGAAPTPAARAKAPVWQQRIIAATSVLTTGESWSTDRLRLTVTTGGDLVLQDQGRTVWRTGTTTGVKLVMQNDGHLVLYDARNGTAWSSGTAGNPGAVLILRADGDLVISLNGRTLFHTATGD
jgi:hypothetical protein